MKSTKRSSKEISYQKAYYQKHKNEPKSVFRRHFYYWRRALPHLAESLVKIFVRDHLQMLKKRKAKGLSVMGFSLMSSFTQKGIARKGGRAISRDRKHMAVIGRKGGMS